MAQATDDGQVVCSLEDWTLGMMLCGKRAAGT